MSIISHSVAQVCNPLLKGLLAPSGLEGGDVVAVPLDQGTATISLVTAEVLALTALAIRRCPCRAGDHGRVAGRGQTVGVSADLRLLSHPRSWIADFVGGRCG